MSGLGRWIGIWLLLLSVGGISACGGGGASPTIPPSGEGSRVVADRSENGAGSAAQPTMGSLCAALG